MLKRNLGIAELFNPFTFISEAKTISWGDSYPLCPSSKQCMLIGLNQFYNLL